MPVFDMIESYMIKTLNFSPGRPLRLIGRSTYVGKYKFILVYKCLYISTTGTFLVKC